MPYGDGTGPMGIGPGAGRGRGPCGRGDARLGRGGFWRGCIGSGAAWRPPVSGKRAIAEEARLLKARLEALERRSSELPEEGK